MSQGKECVNPLTDRLNCGADLLSCGGGQVCAEGEVCDGAGQCALSCQEGYSLIVEA